MKKRTFLATAAVAAAGFAAPAFAQDGDCSVGIAMYTLGAPYFAAQAETARQVAEEAGCEVRVADGQNDMVKQIGDVEDMVAAGIDILILNPRDAQGLVASANMASAQGVHVIAIDSTLDPSADFITQIQSSNTANGELVGQWLANELNGEPARIALISGSQGNLVGRERRLGVLRGLMDAQLTSQGDADIEVLGQGWGNWATEGGLTAMEDLLTAHPDINVVLGENDSMVLGARSALQAAGRLDEVILVAAADGQKEALQLIKDGEYGATGLNNPNEIARRAVEIGLQAMNDELPEGLSKLTYTDPAAITQENVDQYLDPESVF
ncbi:ribose transport system substrate-binding protein [Palleronia aestuarii]|uniref:Ribose transport system substrate-binding protein n=1 Tax=Palleronia aestuarii TaxID=568105 RepID=A0A2W7N1H5_9RHOB|nr:substrate-binding domain-containing protein [Palleronia aestuarii]PZX12207.1 ribose transport system substrate-binding protein [Palleronia aestuarii]